MERFVYVQLDVGTVTVPMERLYFSLRMASHSKATEARCELIDSKWVSVNIVDWYCKFAFRQKAGSL
jgi:hypothetical protein